MDNKQAQSIDTRERVRKSFDKIKVNNPFDKDYPTFWDGFPHVVRAKSFAIMERFLAEKWLEEQCKRIITERADGAIKDENKRRITNNQLPMDKTRKTGEQYEFETSFYADWTAQFKNIVKEFGLYGGLVEEYGMNFQPEVAPQNNQIVRSLLDELDEEPVQTKPEVVHEGGNLEPSLVDELEGKDVFTLRKIAKEKGLVTERTDKKADLIKAITA